MAMVVTEPCVNCKDKSCTLVCPTDCFHDVGSMLVIDPEECIDCEACIPQCPVEAIFYQGDVPQKWQQYIELNRELSKTSPRAYKQ
jgi:ferredoxin